MIEASLEFVCGLLLATRNDSGADINVRNRAGQKAVHLAKSSPGVPREPVCERRSAIRKAFEKGYEKALFQSE